MNELLENLSWASNKDKEQTECQKRIFNTPIESKTIELNVAATCAFGIELALAIYIFVRYLIIQSKCTQRSMMVFYILSMADISTRMAFMIASCFYH